MGCETALTERLGQRRLGPGPKIHPTKHCPLGMRVQTQARVRAERGAGAGSKLRRLGEIWGSVGGQDSSARVAAGRRRSHPQPSSRGHRNGCERWHGCLWGRGACVDGRRGGLWDARKRRPPARMAKMLTRRHRARRSDGRCRLRLLNTRHSNGEGALGASDREQELVGARSEAERPQHVPWPGSALMNPDR